MPPLPHRTSLLRAIVSARPFVTVASLVSSVNITQTPADVISLLFGHLVLEEKKIADVLVIQAIWLDFVGANQL